MALIECPQCDTKVSDSAQACPKCGTAVDEKFIQKSQKQQKNRKINKFAFLIFGVILLGMLLVSLFSEEKMNEEWRDSYLKRLNLLNEEIKPGLTKVFNEFYQAVLEDDPGKLHLLCWTEEPPYLPRWRNRINAINEDMPKLDDASFEVVEAFKTAHRESELDCFYNPGYVLYSRLDTFCSNFKEYGLDNSVINLFKTITAPKITNYILLSKENRQACIDLVLEHSQ